MGTAASAGKSTDGTSVRRWLRAKLIHAVKNAAQSAVDIIPVSTALSVLTSIAGVPEVAYGSSLNDIATQLHLPD